MDHPNKIDGDGDHRANGLIESTKVTLQRRCQSNHLVSSTASNNARDHLEFSVTHRDPFLTRGCGDLTQFQLPFKYLAGGELGQIGSESVKRFRSP